jgi:hypothetical protein
MTLLSTLLTQQNRVLGILDGLDEAALRRPVLPSGWSCAGMVRHLTVGTRFWFEEVMCGRPLPEVSDDFQVDGTEPVAPILAAFAEQAPAAVELVRDLPLDTPPAWWPEGQWGGWRLANLGEVLLHSLVETSTHAGHLDAARELIDGRTWDYARGRLGEN